MTIMNNQEKPKSKSIYLEKTKNIKEQYMTKKQRKIFTIKNT